MPEYITENLNTIIDFLIRFLPSFIFICTVIGAGLWGVIRGARKSVILLIHALVSFAICFILFLVFVNSKGFDKLLLNITNSIIGSDTGLQDLLEVNPECESIRECILDFIPRQMSFMDGLELILRDNGAYLSTLVDLVYRIVFGLILYIVYLLLVFIFYIIYFIFYPERRYKKKINKKHKENLSDTPYKKNRLVGGMIGIIRGAASGVIALSFLGTLFFIVSGGTGEERDPDIAFTDDGVNVAYTAYQSISSYGSSGIFKVLNMMKDSKDTPYYLFAADLIFQGDLEDVNRGLDTNVYFRDEIAAYVDFSKDTFKLLLKYGEEDLLPILNNEYDGDPMDVIINVMSMPEFQSEFTSLITNFDSKTYFINLSLSLVDSIARNFDSLEFSQGMPKEIVEIVNITFKKDYYSDYIPYERELKNKLNNNTISKEDAALPNINASDLVTKDDIVEILGMLFDFINLSNDENDEANDTFNVIRAMVPHIKNLSMFNSNKDKLNSVIKRLYAFVDEVYLQADDDKTNLSASNYENKKKLYYISEDYDSINWIDELLMIVNVAEDAFKLYNSVYDSDKEIIDILFDIFEIEENIAIYDNLSKTIYNSKIIGEVLSSNLAYKTIENVFKDMIDDYHMPRDISYSNKYDSSGNLVKTGELYQFLTAIKHIFSNADNKEFIDSLSNESNMETKELINTVVDKLTTKADGVRLCDYLVNSRILQSVLSGFVLKSIKLDGEPLIYADKSVLEQDLDGNTLDIITRDELLLFFDLAPDFVDIATPLLDDFDNTDAMLDILENEKLITIFDSVLIEGTVSNLLVAMLDDNEIIILPDQLKNKEKMISSADDVSDVKKLCMVLQDSTFDISTLLSGDDLDVSTITSEEINLLIESNILYYTISGYLVNNKETLISNFSLVIPASVLQSEKLIYKNDLSSLFENMIPLIPKKDENGDTPDFDTNDLISRILDNQDACLNNDIIAATMSHAIVANEDVKNNLGDMIIIPSEYEEDAIDVSKLEYIYTKDNRWYFELDALFDSIRILLGDADISKLSDEIVNNILKLNEYTNEEKNQTKLEIVYESNILLASISNKMDNEIRNNNVISEDLEKTNKVLSSCQNSKGYYYFNDLESIIDSFTIFDIKTNENNELELDSDTLVDKVSNDILSFNEPCTKIERLNEIDEAQRPSTLNVLYGSGVMRSILSTQLFDILSDEALLGMTNDDNRYLVDGFEAYYEKEVSSLIKLLNYLGITSEDLNKVSSNEEGFSLDEKISNNIFNIKDKLDELYEANFTGVLLYKQLSNNEYIIPNSVYMIIDSARSNVIIKAEAYALIDVMDKLDIDFNTAEYSFNDFDVDNTSIEEIYESAVIKYYISDELYIALERENLFDIAVLKGHNELVKDYNPLDDNTECIGGWYKASEVQGLLEFTKKSLDIDISSDLSANSSSYYIDKLTGKDDIAIENRNRLNNTLIGQSILTNKLGDYINSEKNKFLVHSNFAYMDYNSIMIEIYTFTEIDSLFSIVNSDIDSFNSSSVDLNSIKELVSSDVSDDDSIKSNILNASITNKFNSSSNPVHIPLQAYSTEGLIIKPLQMHYFLNGIDLMLDDENRGKIDISSFDKFMIPDEEYFDEIAKSIIIRATITQNITVDQSIDLICSTADVIKEYDINNEYIAIFDEEETINVMYTIKTVTAGNAKFKVTINDIINNATAEIFNSSFICAILTNYFVDKGFTINTLEALTGITIDLYEVLNIKSLDIYDAYVIASNDMLLVINTIRGSL